MKSSKPFRNRAVIIPSLGIIAIVGVIGILSSLVLVSATGSSSTTIGISNSTTSTTTVKGILNAISGNANSTINSPLNAEQTYANSNRSIVTLSGTQVQSTYLGQQQVSVLGSGFVINYSGSFYIITNYHVAGATSNLTVTFSNGDSYPAKVIGLDPYADLAIVTSSGAPLSEYYPLFLSTSSLLKVGDSIVAIGDPYGLTGSMTEGIVSQLGRTIQDPTAGNFSIADVIQFSAPINPGNSGGPLINANGQVVGITTATVYSSQGLGFAIPSDTIIRELPSLVKNGTYTLHSYLGIQETDMNYQLSHATGANVTYGVLLENIVQGGPSAKAGLRAGTQAVTVNGQQYLIGGDIIVSINGTRIINGDSLGTYLAEYTVTGQSVSLGIIRSGQYMTVYVTLGARPALS